MRVEPQATTGEKQTTPASVDNAAQAVIAERERTFTMGGDGPAAGGGTGGGPRPAAPAVLLDGAILRAKAVDRPSPFGVAQFPTLPEPPARAGKPR